MDFFPVDWTSGDGPDGAPWDDPPRSPGSDDGAGACFRVRAVGRGADGRCVVAHIDWNPYFFVDLGAAAASDAAAKLELLRLVRRWGAVPDACCVVRRKSMWGFTNGATMRVGQLAFPTNRAAQRARYGLKRASTTTYEASVDPLVRLFHVRGVRPGAWATVRPRASHVDGDTVHVLAGFRDLGPCARADKPRLQIASWDLECYSESGNFPIATNPSDKIIQIAVTLSDYASGESTTTVVCLGETDPLPDVEVVPMATEEDVIAEFARLVAGADVLLSYNGNQFDWRYLAGRIGVLVDDHTGEPLVDVSAFGRVRGDPAAGTPVETSLKSAAYGDNAFFMLATPGQLNLDLLQYVRREHKLDKYSLNAVSEKFLGDAKLDLPAAQIFERFRGTSADRAVIAAYAAKDTRLPLALTAKLAVLENLLEMANAVTVPVSYLLLRGQQIKVWSLVLACARAKGFVCPDDAGISLDDGEKYTGATVLDAQRGAYFDIVSGLDFASLYPSILRGYNLCPSTLVMDAKKYGAVPGVEYYTVDTGMGVHAFAQTRDGERVESVVPGLLEQLAQFRTAAKRDMAAAKARGDAFGAALANGKQLAYKVSANSVYGFLGASKGFLPCLPVAAAVTATGRAMIVRTSELVRQLVPGSRVVYGDTDSVMVILALGEAARHDMAAHFAAAGKVAAQISEEFPHPVELEFEKCYYPYLLFSKKRYSGEFLFLGERIMARARVSGITVLFVLLVLLDAYLGFALYKTLVQKTSSVVGTATGAPPTYATYTTRKAMRSRALWGLVSAGVAAAAASAAAGFA
jgi:DNA polymerase delta subunit 1